MRALITDLYELTMVAGYYEAGKLNERATFELSVRRLPSNRDYLVVAGLEQALDYLLNVEFSGADIDYLLDQAAFASVSAGFWDYLRGFKFRGDVWAVPEGTPIFAGEPMLRISAPLAEAQLPETYLLATMTFQTLIATKASRIVQAAVGRPVIEFGTRRAHTAEAGTLGARAAYIGGCTGTSNVEAGRRFGIPVYGTAAHSWTLAFDSEREAFEQLQRVLGERTIYLVDTYDVEQAVNTAVALGRPFHGIRLDSGDFAADSRLARQILDRAGYSHAQIMASGDLNEYRIAELVRARAPIDSFGVGTELATSGDAPSMASIYKLVEMERKGQRRFPAKRSSQKVSLPGAKQIFRFHDHDVVGLRDEVLSGATPLLEPVIRSGNRIAASPSLIQIRERAAQNIAQLPSPFPVVYSERLNKLITEN